MDNESAITRFSTLAQVGPQHPGDSQHHLRKLGPPGLKPEVTYRYRKGDIRHCFADISKISALGYEPRVKFEDGIRNWRIGCGQAAETEWTRPRKS